MDIEYYAIFNYDEYDSREKEYGLSITFPDITEANTCARNDSEGLEMALEVLQLCLVKDDGSWPAKDSLPFPTPLDRIKLRENEKAVLIRYNTQDVDMSKFKWFKEGIDSY